jgi:hypothetical protein
MAVDAPVISGDMLLNERNFGSLLRFSLNDKARVYWRNCCGLRRFGVDLSLVLLCFDFEFLL